MTTSAIELSGKQPVDMFFDREPVFTDWDNIRRLILEGSYHKKDELMARLKSYEPLNEADPREHEHWVDQQCLRLILLHEANLPLEGTETCERCGTRKMDPLMEKHTWNRLCLHCLDLSMQTPRHSGRGSCEYIKPAYNPRSHSWGLLYYWSHGRDNAFLFWLADFYRTREEADRALWPIFYYYEWLSIKHSNMLNSLDANDLLPLDEVMNLQLPLTPESFRAHVRSAIEADMNQEQRVMGYYVRDAMNEHERNERNE